MDGAQQISAINPDWLGGRSFEECWQAYEEDGYITFPGILDADQVARVRESLEPHFTKAGRNVFEGFQSNRVYGLIEKDPPLFSAMVTHPLALAFVDRELGENPLLSALLAINLHPGETVQPWHLDDGHIRVPAPRPAFGVSTFWTIDPMTETNGATEVIPGSHKATHTLNSGGKEILADGANEREEEAFKGGKKVILPAGSLMIAKGNLWHRGGANTSNGSRLIVTPQYCAGWARPLETMLLSISQETAKKLPKRVQELIGYSIYGAFMGYVDGMHPAKVLEA